MTAKDSVDRAFDILRAEHGPALPDRELERELRRVFARAPRRRTRRIALSLVAAAALGGAAFAAAGGVEWLRGWWYRVEVDGAPIEGRVDGEGGVGFDVATADGGTASVRVQRDRVDGGARTRIAIDRRADGRVERERAEDVVGAGPARPRVPAAQLAGETPLYVGADAAGERLELYALERGTRIVLWRPARDAEHAVELARLPFSVLVDGATASITEREDGGLELAFDDGRGASLVFVLDADGAPPRPTSTLETADGAVRVEVQNTPLPASPGETAQDGTGGDEDHDRDE